MKSDSDSLTYTRTAVLLVGCTFLFASQSFAKIKTPLPYKLAEWVEYCYLIEVTASNEHGRGLGYMVLSVLRKQGRDLPGIELYTGEPEKGVYLVIGINNHLNRPYPPEYRWEFYKMVRTRDGTQVIKGVDPKIEIGYVHYDMSLDAFKDLLSKHPFRGKHP